jgi:hypothetical protein
MPYFFLIALQTSEVVFFPITIQAGIVIGINRLSNECKQGVKNERFVMKRFLNV